MPLGGVGPQARQAGLEDPALEDRRLGGGQGFGVEDLQGLHRGQVRVGPEAAHAGRHPPEGGLPLVVGPAGCGQGERLSGP